MLPNGRFTQDVRSETPGIFKLTWHAYGATHMYINNKTSCVNEPYATEPAVPFVRNGRFISVNR